MAVLIHLNICCYSDMDMTWMYNARRTDAYFREELNKFIQVAEKHAKNEKTQLMHCPCKACKNLRVFSDPIIIRSHVVVSGFVKDYTIWKYHGETDAPPPMNNPLDEITQDELFDRIFDAYYNGGGDDDGVGRFHADDVDDGPIHGDRSDDELGDRDFLSQLLRHTKSEVLVASARGLANFVMVRNSAKKNIYDGEGLDQVNDGEDLNDIREVTIAQRSGLRRTTTASRNIQGNQEKRLKRGARIEEMMERFLEKSEEETTLMAKQVEEESARQAKQAEGEVAYRAKQEEEEEAAHLAKEKEAAECNDFSIKRCISVLNTLDVTKEEKAKAYVVFIKSKENREAFISGCELDVESTLIWLRNEMV